MNTNSPIFQAHIADRTPRIELHEQVVWTFFAPKELGKPR